MSLLSVLILSSFIDQEEEIDGFQLVEDKCFYFEAESMTSQTGFHKTLTSSYHLTLCGDSAKAYLPYVGRAYSAAYGGDGGIQFDNTLLGYSSELKTKKKEKNNLMLITFKVKSENEIYDVTMSIGKSGFCTVSVRSNNRQSCSYNGHIMPIEKEE